MFSSEPTLLDILNAQIFVAAENNKKRSWKDLDINYDIFGAIVETPICNKRMKRTLFNDSISSFEDCETKELNLFEQLNTALDLDALDEMIASHEERTSLNMLQHYVIPPPLIDSVSIGSSCSSQSSSSTFMPMCLPVSDSIPVVGNNGIPLTTDEDANWLSDFLCYVRSDIVQVFQASEKDVGGRAKSKRISLGQVGIRCKFCTHLPKRRKARRSATFPSSTDKIYQSFIMMLRDHFGNCDAMPADTKAKFMELRANATQGAVDSKKYWASSARILGMVDTVDRGIQMAAAPSQRPLTPTEEVSASNSDSIESSMVRAPVHLPQTPLMEPSDLWSTSEYTFLLMNQVDRVYLTKEEKVGNRRSMEEGLSGFGCKYCSKASRKGMCRFFPARRRTLPNRLQDLHEHLLKCQLCPEDVKSQLANLGGAQGGISLPETNNQKMFLDIVWSRLRRTRGGVSSPSKRFTASV